MKRIFLMLFLIPCCLTCGLERSAKSRPDVKSFPKPTIHDLMANRQIAPHMAWMILWANFSQDYNVFLKDK